MGKEVVYAFIDSQNLNLGTSKDLYNKTGRKIYTGWRLDFSRFYRYLVNKFRISKALFFIGYLEKHQNLYTSVKSFGYEIVFKPTITDTYGKTKGNVDAEMVLHSAAIQFNNYDKAVVVSSDGDFYCLYEYLEGCGKLERIILPNRKNASTLLHRFEKYQYELIRDKTKVEFRNKNGRRGALSRR